MSMARFMTGMNSQESQLILSDEEDVQSKVTHKESRIVQFSILFFCATVIIVSALVLVYSQVSLVSKFRSSFHLSKVSVLDVSSSSQVSIIDNNQKDVEVTDIANHEGIMVYSGDYGTWTHHGHAEDSFSVDKLLSCSSPEVFKQNYWLAPDGETGSEFVLSLGQSTTVRNILLVNTHNGYHKDRASKEFKVFLSDSPDGPWTKVLQDQLPDSRNLEPVPSKNFKTRPTTARFVRFKLISYWGHGGGLQYFTVNQGKTQYICLVKTSCSI